jgi:hypothetical protein
MAAARPLKHNADYFAHSVHLRNLPEVKALRAEHGLEGYAVFCMLLEYITDQDNWIFRLRPQLVKILAGDFGVSAETLNEVIEFLREVEFLIPQIPGVEVPNAKSEPLLCPYISRVMAPLKAKRDEMRDARQTDPQAGRR